MSSSSPSVQVMCRFRPMNEKELRESGEVCVSLTSTSATIDLSAGDRPNGGDLSSTGGSASLGATLNASQPVVSNNLQFTFDRVFSPTDSQKAVYEQVVSPLVRDCCSGFNCTVIAYGQTGSGKTHTMEGPPGCSSTSDDAGVLPRVADDLFKYKEALEGGTFQPRSGAEAGPVNDVSCSISLSVIEIYLERIIDLLDSSSQSSRRASVSSSNDLLRIREDASGGVYLEGAVEHQCTSPASLLSGLEAASKRRSTGGHAMNARSSRSHLVAIITVKQTRAGGGGATGGKLYICDLAGSEMVRKTEAEGQRLREAQAINRSLSALGNVINALTQSNPNLATGSTAQPSHAHVPYRDSKLTRLLQDSLGGNAKTALIVTASVSSSNAPETLSTLRFGSRARRLKNAPRVNAERTIADYKRLLKAADAMVADLSKEASDLRVRLAAVCAAGSGRGAVRSLAAASSQPTRDDDGEGEGSDDEDDALDSTFLPTGDSDLALLSIEAEEAATLRARVEVLEREIAAAAAREREGRNRFEDELRRREVAEREGRARSEEEIAKANEEIAKVKAAAEEKLHDQFSRGYRIGSVAFGGGENSKVDDGKTGLPKKPTTTKSGDESFSLPDNDGGTTTPPDSELPEQGSAEDLVERSCQICGLSEVETAAHENADEANPTLLGPLFTCDGNCCTYIHTSCAGLSSLPTGEWYCQDCTDIPIDDPLPSPMRKEHEDFESAAASSLAELSAVRGRFAALRKQRDRLLARWKGERETQRRVELAKRKLRKKREEEIVRLREVVLVLQEEVDLSEEDRAWLMSVMDSSATFSPNRIGRAQRMATGKRSASIGGRDSPTDSILAPTTLPSLQIQIPSEYDSNIAFSVMKGESPMNISQPLASSTPTASAALSALESSDEVAALQRQFGAAKQQIHSQQRQLAKYMKVIQDQQEKLKNAESSLSVGKTVGGALLNSPFGPVTGVPGFSAPPSPTMFAADEAGSGGTAFRTMKSWWAGDAATGAEGSKCEAEDKKEDADGASRRRESLARTEGVVAEKADQLSAPFRNRLIGLLSSIEKEANDYKTLKDKIVTENQGLRNTAEERQQRAAKRRESQRDLLGLPPRGDKGSVKDSSGVEIPDTSKMASKLYHSASMSELKTDEIM